MLQAALLQPKLVPLLAERNVLQDLIAPAEFAIPAIVLVPFALQLHHALH